VRVQEVGLSTKTHCYLIDRSCMDNYRNDNLYSPSHDSRLIFPSFKCQQKAHHRIQTNSSTVSKSKCFLKGGMEFNFVGEKN
jgi:hypothetical protein